MLRRPGRLLRASPRSPLRASGHVAPLPAGSILRDVLGRKFNSALSFPQLSQVDADCYGRVHIVHRNPFERPMRVVLTAEHASQTR
jgi:hypothetical protein